MTDYHMLINGQAVSADESFDVLNPATEEVIASVPKATSGHLDDAVAAAKAAQPAWAALSMDDRRAIILKVADRIEENLTELGALLSSEQGKP
ncbi:MAG: aldehyde dehydrogenase family protein, partial [Halieaceae bacterium]